MIERYTRPEMGRIWSDQHRFDVMLEVELLVCEALAKRGVVPVEAVRTIRERARVDPKRVAVIEAEVRHDVIAFVTATGAMDHPIRQPVIAYAFATPLMTIRLSRVGATDNTEVAGPS